MKFIKSVNNEIIRKLRSKLHQELKAPIDAMWEQLYIISSEHYLIQNGENIVGYCCVNDQGCLLQIYLLKVHKSMMENVITNLIDLNLVKSASLSSNEPIAFNIVLSKSKSVKTNTFCFEHINKPIDIQSNLNIKLVQNSDIPDVKIFLKEQVGMVDTFGYTENLVARKEIYMVKEAEIIIAISERRNSDSQTQISDLGIIVNKKYQGKGLATEIMQLQVNNILNSGRKPICSTTHDNIAAQKVIEKSGFYCSNIIFDISLT